MIIVDKSEVSSSASFHTIINERIYVSAQIVQINENPALIEFLYRGTDSRADDFLSPHMILKEAVELGEFIDYLTHVILDPDGRLQQ